MAYPSMQPQKYVRHSGMYMYMYVASAGEVKPVLRQPQSVLLANDEAGQASLLRASLPVVG